MKFSLFYLMVFGLLLMSCQDSKKENIPKLKPGINWMTIDEAEIANAKKPKDFFIMVHANWCPKCSKFKTETYSNPKVIEEINSMFYPVMINAHDPKQIKFNGVTYSNPDFDSNIGLEGQNSYHEILFELGAKSIPSIVFLNKKLEIVGQEMGFKEASELRSLMRLYADN